MPMPKEKFHHIIDVLPLLLTPIKATKVVF